MTATARALLRSLTVLALTGAAVGVIASYVAHPEGAQGRAFLVVLLIGAAAALAG